MHTCTHSYAISPGVCRALDGLADCAGRTQRAPIGTRLSLVFTTAAVTPAFAVRAVVKRASKVAGNSLAQECVSLSFKGRDQGAPTEWQHVELAKGQTLYCGQQLVPHLSQQAGPGDNNLP